MENEMPATRDEHWTAPAVAIDRWFGVTKPGRDTAAWHTILTGVLPPVAGPLKTAVTVNDPGCCLVCAEAVAAGPQTPRSAVAAASTSSSPRTLAPIIFVPFTRG
jgi:hypothetical protein